MKPNTSFSQGGQTAALGSGHGRSPWHLAAFAGFRNGHSPALLLNLWAALGEPPMQTAQPTLSVRRTTALILNVTTSQDISCNIFWPEYFGYLVGLTVLRTEPPCPKIVPTTQTCSWLCLNLISILFTKLAIACTIVTSSRKPILNSKGGLGASLGLLDSPPCRS